MNRGPNVRRYWSSLTGIVRGAAPEQDGHGQTFWQRYIAPLFVLPQRPGEPETDGESAPERTGTGIPRLSRYQSVVLAGVAVLAVIVVSVTQSGGGSHRTGATGTDAGIGGTAGHTTSPTSSSSPSTPTTSPSKPGPWEGTIRVAMNGEKVTSGPPPGAGLVFGLAVGGQGDLVGPGTLAAWTQDSSPTAAKCSALLQAHAVYQATVKVGDELCVAALNGRAASVKVSAEDQNASDGVYIDLQVVAYAPAS